MRKEKKSLNYIKIDLPEKKKKKFKIIEINDNFEEKVYQKFKNQKKK